MSQQKIDAIERFSTSSLLAALNTLDLPSLNTLIATFNYVAKEVLCYEPEDLLPEAVEGQEIAQILNQGSVDVKDFLSYIGDCSTPKTHMWDCRPPAGLKESFLEVIEQMNQNRPHSKMRLAEFKSSDHSGLLTTMWQSKRVIADTLQENVRRYYAGEPLIPIKMVIRAALGTADEFNPSSQSQAKKEDAFITPAEIRMIFKLRSAR